MFLTTDMYNADGGDDDSDTEEEIEEEEAPDNGKSDAGNEKAPASNNPEPKSWAALFLSAYNTKHISIMLVLEVVKAYYFALCDGISQWIWFLA